MVMAGPASAGSVSATGCGRHLVVILRSFPRLSQTFVLQEILCLERLGFELEIHAITHPREPVTQEQVARVKAPVRYLTGAGGRPPAAVADHARVLAGRPLRYLRTAGFVLRRRDLDRGYRTASRLVCFHHAVRIAATLRRSAGTTHQVHSHFAHDPTLIAMLVNRLTGVPFSFTAHARDLYQLPPRTLAERIAGATAVVTCCEANLRYLESVAAPAHRRKLRLVHHGVDLSAFRPHRPSRPDGRAPLVVSAGRLVEKKGFDDLLRACRLVLDRGVALRLVVYGDGPLRTSLLELADALQLGPHVTLPGPRTQRRLAEELRRADVFALTPVVTESGDRDGIPNVILEAMACGVPVLATRAGGVEEAVIDGQTGLLAHAGDTAGIAAGLERLLTDAALRRRLGGAAREAVTRDFDATANSLRLASVLTLDGRPR
jgi:glycosyltransferase involved in cell wall biosynthesis